MHRPDDQRVVILVTLAVCLSSLEQLPPMKHWPSEIEWRGCALTTNRSAILQATNGEDVLLLTQSLNGVCAPGDPILYGEDKISGCNLLITSNTTCDSLRAAIQAAILSPLSNYTHVAVYGDSNYQNLGDWTQIIQGTTTEGSQTNNSCQLVTSVDHQFIVAPVGTDVNPQNKILGLRIVYHKSTLR